MEQNLISSFFYLDKKKFTGINGATAYINDGYEQHTDGSFTLYATIENQDSFKMRYMDYTLEQAIERFKDILQIEVDKYFINK